MINPTSVGLFDRVHTFGANISGKFGGKKIQKIEEGIKPNL